ncbi:MAG: 50S ribosomal protein L9 [Geminicoccaceae bacterium]|nr:50S ribosomal protein L9 [Geminicoccaceae bacterium]
MQVILLERVPKLGQMGQIVNVKPGYARNFLIPKGKALRATETALGAFDSRRAQLEAQNLERRNEAEEASTIIDGASVVILRQASEGSQLYGSVSPRDIADAFTEQGITFTRQQIRLESPLKTLGIHSVTVALHPEVEVQVSVNIARSHEEAEIQAGKAAPVLEEEAIDPESDEFTRGSGFDELGI